MQNTLNRTISVIIPCWNYARYLSECIESITKQTLKPLEIIIVNDGSPDNTSEVAKELIEKYPDHNIILIEKENGGLSSARNAGLKTSTSEYAMCLDADDKIVPEALQRHMELIEDDMTIAQCGLMEFGERHIAYAPGNTSLERIMQSNTVFCNAVFSKRMWNIVGGYDKSEIMRLGLEDWEFWLRMLAAGCKVRTSDFIALRYRAHQNNMTKQTTHPNHQKLYSYIYNKHIDLYNKYNLTISGHNLN